MAQTVPLQKIPNQSLTISLDGAVYDIELRSTGNMMAASVSRNGVAIIKNARAVAGGLLIPARYQEDGNFVWLCGSYELPDYNKFGVTQYLVHFSAAELAAMRVIPAPIITEAFFNPIAATPLRFKPQGYST